MLELGKLQDLFTKKDTMGMFQSIFSGWDSLKALTASGSPNFNDQDCLIPCHHLTFHKRIVRL